MQITEDVLLRSGFKEFSWMKESSVFESNHFKCTLNENGVSLFCDDIKNLHTLQNQYFDLMNKELQIDYSYVPSSKKETL